MRNALSRKAFSFIEILVVTTVIGAVVGWVAVPSMKDSLYRQNGMSCRANLAAIECAKDKYFNLHPGASSVTLEELASTMPGGQLPRCPDNPNEDYSSTGGVFYKGTVVTCIYGGYPYIWAGSPISSIPTDVIKTAPDGYHDLGGDSGATAILDNSGKTAPVGDGIVDPYINPTIGDGGVTPVFSPGDSQSP